MRASRTATTTALFGQTDLNMRNHKKDGQSTAEQSLQMMEDSNNEQIAKLGDQVALMHSVARDIESGLMEDNALLKDTGNTLDKVASMMRGTLGNVQQMLNTGGSKHMCYLVSFIVCLFFVLYWLMK